MLILAKVAICDFSWRVDLNKSATIGLWLKFDKFIHRIRLHLAIHFKMQKIEQSSMKSTIAIVFCFVTGLIQAQFISRNVNILKKSSALIYDNIQEAQRLLSFVNNSNSEKNHHILSLLILSDAAYLKGDFVAVLNNLYQAEELADGKDAQTQLLVRCYLTKYYRILGFGELSEQYNWRSSDLQKIPNAYNVKSQILFEQAVICESPNEKTKLLNLALTQIDSAALFATPLENEIKLKLAALYLQRNLADSTAFYLKTVLKSGGKVFKARALIIHGQLFSNLTDYKSADSLLSLSPDVISQLLIYKKLVQTDSEIQDKTDYKRNILASNELQNTVDQNVNSAKGLVISHIENQKTRSETAATNYWLWVFIGLIVCCFGVVFYYIKTKKAYRQFQKIMQSNVQEKKEEAIRSNSIPEKTEQELLKKLAKFEQSQKFLQPDISLTSLAKSMDTNTKYLSDVINRNKRVNFNQYINDQRIQYIIEKMKSEPKYLNYKIFYLAEECGFSSQSSFSTVFKSVTGISPLSFIKFLKNEIKD